MDEIVAACQYRDMVLVFTRRGKIYKMFVDESGLKFVLYTELFPT